MSTFKLKLFFLFQFNWNPKLSVFEIKVLDFKLEIQKILLAQYIINNIDDISKEDVITYNQKGNWKKKLGGWSSALIETLCH